MPRNCCDQFIARRIQDPAGPILLARSFNQKVSGFAFVAQRWSFYKTRCVTRKAPDRVFVVNNTNRNSAPPKAANNFESLEIAANNDSADFLVSVKEPPSSCLWRYIQRSTLSLPG